MTQQLGSDAPKAFKNKPVDPVVGETPPATEVRKFHTHADTDGNEASAHHTLGPGHNQASPGDHDHRGGSSSALLAGTTITGAKAGNAALTSVIAALVELGATDTTT